MWRKFLLPVLPCEGEGEEGNEGRNKEEMRVQKEAPHATQELGWWDRRRGWAADGHAGIRSARATPTTVYNGRGTSGEARTARVVDDQTASRSAPPVRPSDCHSMFEIHSWKWVCLSLLVGGWRKEATVVGAWGGGRHSSLPSQKAQGQPTCQCGAWMPVGKVLPLERRSAGN